MNFGSIQQSGIVVIIFGNVRSPEHCNSIMILSSFPEPDHLLNLRAWLKLANSSTRSLHLPSSMPATVWPQQGRLTNLRLAACLPFPHVSSVTTNATRMSSLAPIHVDCWNERMARDEPFSIESMDFGKKFQVVKNEVQVLSFWKEVSSPKFKLLRA